MKFYETHFEEYVYSVEKYNLHKELEEKYEKFPKTLNEMKNIIVYGAPGVGKYSQILYFLKRYSPSGLKYEKKITVSTDKQTYIYRISDIHYEIDMSLLGCNSKILFHEIYSQIVDIVSVKSDKHGIILCKNFHTIHNELLENFYSYMQQNHLHTNIQLKFILMTEHLSFISNNILNSCYVLSIPRPEKSKILEMYKINNTFSDDPPCGRIVVECRRNYRPSGASVSTPGKAEPPKEASLSCVSITETLPMKVYPLHQFKPTKDSNGTLSHFNPSGSLTGEDLKCPILNLHQFKMPIENKFISDNNGEQFFQRIAVSKSRNIDYTKIQKILDDVSTEHIINNKEIHYFSLLKNTEELPKDNFNIICDNIIHEMINYEKIIMPVFRDVLYDILIYNLDVAECVWYILCFFIKNESLSPETISKVLTKIFKFLKYFQNNYRPIFHLESIILTMIKEIYKI